jgi:hypothetical protein
MILEINHFMSEPIWLQRISASTPGIAIISFGVGWAIYGKNGEEAANGLTELKDKIEQAISLSQSIVLSEINRSIENQKNIEENIILLNKTLKKISCDEVTLHVVKCE